MIKHRTVMTLTAAFAALLLVASPALGGEPGGAQLGEPQARTEAAKSADATPANESADADRVRQQDRDRDQTCDPTLVDTECSGDQTRTRSQTMTQSQARECSASVDATMTRSMNRLRAGETSGTQEPALNVIRAEAQNRLMVGDAFAAMVRLAERLFAWLDVA